MLADGTTLLLCRGEDRRGLSDLCVARSANGVDDRQIDSPPTLISDPEHGPDELWGIEDPRITYVPELGQYVVANTAYASGCPGEGKYELEKHLESEGLAGHIVSLEDAEKMTDHQIVVRVQKRFPARSEFDIF